MRTKTPSYLIRRTYSYHARIRIPKDIRNKFCYKHEFRVSLRTTHLSGAKSKARFIAGLLSILN
jgi:hypothetical protein